MELLLTHGCGAPASWATQHTTVCLKPLNDMYYSLSVCDSTAQMCGIYCSFGSNHKSSLTVNYEVSGYNV